MYYLLVKTHNQTKLKYLCKHTGTKKSALSYCGSGKYWHRHLKKHGSDFSTRILCETSSLKKLKQKGVYYSKLWNIVKSTEWANLIPETCDGVIAWWTGKTRSEETKRKMSIARKGNPGYWLGKHHSAKTKQKMSMSRKGRVLSEEWKRRISLSRTGKTYGPYKRRHKK